MVTPARYWALNASTNTFTPFWSRIMSSSNGFSSMFRPYLNPEHPPGSTAIRRPALSAGTCSCSMNFLTCSEARSVMDSVTAGCCVVVISKTLLVDRNLAKTAGRCQRGAPAPVAERVERCNLRASHGMEPRVQLTVTDWTIIGLYFLLNVAIGWYYKARAGRSVTEYFLSGRNVPWWL